MQKTVGEHTIVMNETPNFYMITKITDIQMDMQAGKIKASDTIWEMLSLLLVSFDDKTGDQALEAVKNITDAEVYSEVISMYTEVMQKIADFNEKKKK